MLIKLTRNLSVLCISLALSFAGLAQDAARIYIEPSGWSLGTTVGLSDLWGNIGTKSPIDHYVNSKYFDKVTFMGGMFGRYTIHPCLGVRFQVDYGSLYATDKWNYDKAKNSTSYNDDAVQRYFRAQDAKDVVFEGTVLLEFTPLRWNPESKLAHKVAQPYIAAGISYFHYTPYSTAGASGRYYNTYDLDLNGQGWGAGYPSKPSQWQPAVPLAIGYRWDVGKHLNIGVEYMYRLTFTNALDDVSGTYMTQAQYAQHLSAGNAALAYEISNKTQYAFPGMSNTPGTLRGNSSNDGYSTLSITFYYKVLTRSREWWH